MSAASSTRLEPEVRLATLGATTALARGGEGSVEEVRAAFMPGGPPLVLKRYHHPERVDAAALARLVGWRRELAPAERGRLDRVTTWPRAVVVDDAGLVGFLMARVPDDFVATVRLPSRRRRTVLREAQYLVAAPEHTRRLGIDDATDRDRLEVIWTLAEALAFLHRRRIVLGDLSTRNVLWCRDPGRALVVDCDAATLGGVGSPMPQASTVDWDDPAQPGLPAASSDVYKLGLFVLRSLSRSFQTRDAAAAGTLLDAPGRWLLGLSLHPDPAARPTADAWERWAAGRRAATSTRSSQEADPR